MSCTASGFLTAADSRLKARNDRVIYAEICAVERQILDAINSCDGNGAFNTLVNGQSPMTSFSGISEITIVQAGEGYIVDSPVIDVTTTAGINFAAELFIEPSSGAVTGFDITNRGEAYEIGDVVTVTHASGATGLIFTGEVSAVTDASAPIVGEILGITITSGGTNYKETPFVVMIDPEATGFDFIATIQLGLLDSIAAIDIVDAGEGYSANSTAVIMGDSTTAAVITTTTSASMYSDLNIDPVYYYEVWAGIKDDQAVKIQIDSVQKYFTDLGYNFLIQVNPSTMNTLQWYISW